MKKRSDPPISPSGLTGVHRVEKGLYLRIKFHAPVPFAFEGVLEAGAIHLGIGPNGIGKSSFLRALAGLLPVEVESSAVLEDRDLLSLSQRERVRWVGLLPQVEEPGMDLTVEEMILLGSYPRWQGGMPGPEDRTRARKVLDDLGLLGLRHRLYSTLSGGERQWVRVARLVVQDPRVVLLDEPDQHLDDKRRQALMDLMRRWRNEGKVVFWVTHNPCGLEKHADRIWRFREGHLVPESDPRV